tara:strand:+ start:831 stop:1685 length:855 start_codon:yes stop_codon:yes gene_type:complete
MYGQQHAEQYELANQLGRHALDMNESNQQNFKLAKIAAKTLSRAQTTQTDAQLQTDAEKDIASVPKIYKTAKVIGTATAVVPATLARGETLGEGLQAGKAVLSEAGAGAKAFGEGAVAAKDLGGVEGIVGNTLSYAGGATEGAELFAKVGAKGVGALGAGIAIGQDFSNALDTGNIFEKKDSATGKVEKQSLGVDIGNVATIAAGGLDLLAAATGGLLAPLAAAANIAAATESTIANAYQESAEKKKDDADLPSATPPTTVAPPAFAQFGLLANQSFNPLDHVS